MKALAIPEFILGAMIALGTMLILVVGGIFAFGSIGKYIKNKAM